jgi:hypothetical protein
MICLPVMILRVGSSDNLVSWDEQTRVAVRKETWHTALISLIINSLVKQILKFDKLRMLILLLVSLYTTKPVTLIASADCFAVAIAQGLWFVTIPHPVELRCFDESRCSRR